jgi:hypothetical protein
MLKDPLDQLSWQKHRNCTQEKNPFWNCVACMSYTIADLIFGIHIELHYNTFINECILIWIYLLSTIHDFTVDFVSMSQAKPNLQQ